MPAAWTGTAGELKLLVNAGTALETLTRGYEAVFGRVSKAEEASWPETLTVIGEVLQDSRFDEVQLAFELEMPVGAERADVVLFGGNGHQATVVVLEVKSWVAVTVTDDPDDLALPGGRLVRHPCLQALSYVGRLRFFHELGSQADVKAAVLMPNLPEANFVALTGATPMELKAAAPLFGGAALDLFAAWLDRLLLPVSCQGAVAKDFASAGYRQAPHLLNLLTEHAAEIADRASSALCGAGVGLTEDQSVLASEILRSARAHDGTVYIVEGGPGSGKTLLAVSLLLQGASCNVRTGLAIRNNRLQAVLRRCLDQTLPGLSGLMMFFETRQGKGVGDAGFNAQFDLLICDEAQRMRRPSIPTALGRSPVTAIFLDESQRLNPPEEGTAVSFSGAARALGRTVTRRSLPTAIRCAGGQAYSDWVDLLLSDPERALRTPRPWADRYVFESRGSFGDMKLRLQFLMQSRPGSRAALVASFTEAPGYLTDPGHPDNRRIGFPLTSGWDGYAGGEEEARWLMQPTEYVKFWMRGQSSNLDRVASIYGAQGFETDFCGVVWGRDLVLRHGKWALGDPGVCFDEVDRLVRDRRTRWDEAALDLVKNRYRVFLTRGIGGTVVIFEDADTRAHVKAFLEAVTG